LQQRHALGPAVVLYKRTVFCNAVTKQLIIQSIFSSTASSKWKKRDLSFSSRTQVLYFLNLLLKQVLSVLNKDSSAKEKRLEETLGLS